MIIQLINIDIINFVLMQFLFPSFLWALLALAIPLIIHLFHFRRFKKVYFTNVDLLKEIKEETSSKNKLKNLLILLSRMAALAMLVFAFAQPIISNKNLEKERQNVVSIIVDNSFSMDALEEEVPLIVKAKDKAREIVSSYGETDEYIILTHDLATKNLRKVDKKTALSFIEEIKSTPSVNQLEDLSNVASRISQDNKEKNHKLFILSDFQQSISTYDQVIDTLVDVSLIPLQSVQENNVAIATATFESPVPLNNANNRLIVHFENNGNTDQDVQFRIRYEGQERPQGVVSIEANGVATDTININVSRVGWHEVELLIDDYPITFDDRLHIAFNVPEEINVLSINDRGDNRYLSSVFTTIADFNLTQLNQRGIQYEMFSAQDLIILDDLNNMSSGLTAELNKYVSNGGNLLIFPDRNIDDSFNTLLGQLQLDRIGEYNDETKQVSNINTDEFIFNEVYSGRKRNIRLPESKGNYAIVRNQRAQKETLLSYRDGQPNLIKYKSQRGQVYLSLTPLSKDYSNLVNSAEIFVPMLYKMALSAGIQKPLYYTIGAGDLVEIEEAKILNNGNYILSGQEEFIPGIVQNNGLSYMDVRDQITKDGIYSLRNAGTEIYKTAYNYDRVESDVRYGDINQVAKGMGDEVEILDNVALANLSQYLDEKNQGTSLWRWCLILALLFLLVETLLLRFWK